MFPYDHKQDRDRWRFTPWPLCSDLPEARLPLQILLPVDRGGGWTRRYGEMATPATANGTAAIILALVWRWRILRRDGWVTGHDGGSDKFKSGRASAVACHFWDLDDPRNGHHFLRKRGNKNGSETDVRVSDNFEQLSPREQAQRVDEFIGLVRSPTDKFFTYTFWAMLIAPPVAAGILLFLIAWGLSGFRVRAST
jgi:hypothetical protein